MTPLGSQDNSRIGKIRQNPISQANPDDSDLGRRLDNPVNHIAKKTFPTSEESFVTSISHSAKRSWKVLKKAISELFQRIFLLFAASVKEGPPRNQDDLMTGIVLNKQEIDISKINFQRTVPIGLVNSWSNMGRNACYRNAVNQMLGVPFFKNLVLGRYADAKGTENGIGKALLNLWTYQQSKNPELSHLWAYDENLLEALCTPLVIPGPSPEDDLYLEKIPGLSIDTKYHQQDASAYLEALFEEFDYKLTVTSTLDGMDGVTTSSKVVEESALLQLSRFGTIEESIANFLHEKITDPENPWKSVSGKSFNTYLKHFKIESEKPLEAITVNVKRKVIDASGDYKIDYSPMMIPKNNVVDLSNAYSLPAGSALYELQGFVWNLSGHVTREGESGGHFIAYVSREGVWYECDDERVTKIDPDADPKKAAEFETRKSQFVLGTFINVSEGKFAKKSLTNA